MSATQDPNPKSQVLTPEDLDAAVRMLADEEQVDRATGRRDFVREFGVNLLTAGFIFGLSAGIIVVWFQFRPGLLLLGLSALAFVTLGILKILNVGTRALDQPQGSAWAETAKRAWDQKFQTEGCFIIPGCLIWFGALIVMLVGLIADRAVFPVLLIPIGLGSLIIAVAGAINTYRKLKYFSRVARLKERLLVHQEAGPEQAADGVNVSDKDWALLSKVEIRQVSRAAVNNFEEYKKETDLYSVAIEDLPLDYLSSLEEASRNVLRKVLNRLQTDPRPANSRLLSKGPSDGIHVIVLEADGHFIKYEVDDSSQRVDVIEISPSAQEVSHAS